MKANALALVVAAFATPVFAQAPSPDHHAAHHPAAAASGPVAPRAGSGDEFSAQMDKMRDMHKRMQAARTPAERQGLMDEHMKLMRSGMALLSEAEPAPGPRGMGMGRMGGMHGQRDGAGPKSSEAAPEAGCSQGMEGMMGMHGAMERRMAMLEQMIQMMVDRESALPRK
ncbi:hypothetical protein GCM10028796_05370 [Ramlibacter monticola]|uniref:DUF4175 family protein n=1 Tax=Ramlibacter monticola TaxID=1926872 RepID=A0A937CTP4_9BURK|nr:hypothetical protein [Ramlibacter monticola]MBL0391187.1 hypothetical protein [Ramlibacter monticola]